MSGQPSKSDDELLWEYYLLQITFSVGQFGLALVGLGALFFAFSQTSSGYLRLVIATVGISASFILWEHTWKSRLTQYRLTAHLKTGTPTAPGRPALIDRLDLILDKRGAPLYLPVHRLFVYFCGLLTVAWISLFLFTVGTPLRVLYVLDGISLAVAATVWFVFRRQSAGHRPSGSAL